MRFYTLKIFFPISFGVHLLFLLMATLLVPISGVEQIPPPHMEVSLLPLSFSNDGPSLRRERLVKPHARKEEKIPAPKERKEEPNVQREVPHREVTSEAVPPIQMSPTPTVVDDPPPVPSLPLDLEPALTSAAEPPPERHEPSSSEVVSLEGPENSATSKPISEAEIFLVRPRYADTPKPRYPKEARQKGYEGEILLRVEVLPDGGVGKVEVKRSSGHEILDRSALAAVRQWKFIPAKKGGNAVSSWVNIPVKFQLQ
jgi:protein TonB